MTEHRHPRRRFLLRQRTRDRDLIIRADELFLQAGPPKRLDELREPLRRLAPAGRGKETRVEDVLADAGLEEKEDWAVGEAGEEVVELHAILEEAERW